MCLRVQPVCNACEHLATTEELFPCSDSVCSSDETEVFKRPLSRVELVNIVCSNPDCNLNPARIESLNSWLRSKVLTMQQRGRQQSRAKSCWAPGNKLPQLNPDNSLSTQQPLPSIFTVLNSGFSNPFASNTPARSFTPLSNPFGSGVTKAGVASQSFSRWSRKVTLTVEESGNIGSASGGCMEFR